MVARPSFVAQVCIPERRPIFQAISDGAIKANMSDPDHGDRHEKRRLAEVGDEPHEERSDVGMHRVIGDRSESWIHQVCEERNIRYEKQR